MRSRLHPKSGTSPSEISENLENIPLRAFVWVATPAIGTPAMVLWPFATDYPKGRVTQVRRSKLLPLALLLQNYDSKSFYSIEAAFSVDGNRSRGVALGN